MRNFFYLVVLCMVFIQFSCNEPKKEEIKIGVVGPFEGPNAHIGKMILNSVNLAFNDFTDEKIKLIPIDTKSDPSTAVSAVQSVVSDSQMVAFIAFYHSSTALSCKQIITEAKIPTLIYSASNPKVTENAPYYFRLVPTDDNQAIVLADYSKIIKAKTAAILYYSDEYGKGLSDGIKLEAKEIGLNIVDIQSYDATTDDFRPILSVMKSKSPDIIYICGFVEKSIDIINQAAEKGLKSTFIAGDGTFNEEQLISGCGKNAEGVYVAAPYVFDTTNTKNNDFLKAYFKAYPTTGNKKPASWSAFAYDAANILINAIKLNYIDRSSIFDYLKKINVKDKAYNGITGPIYFNSSGNAVDKKFRLAVVKNQQFMAVSEK